MHDFEEILKYCGAVSKFGPLGSLLGEIKSSSNPINRKCNSFDVLPES